MPQALDFLVDDVARQHGRLRVGAIECYVRSDDHGLLSRCSTTGAPRSAELRRLAPGVLVSGLGADEVLDGAAGPPATPRPARHPGGAVLTRPPGAPAGGGPPSGSDVYVPAGRPLTPDELEATVREIRAGDAALSARRSEAVRQIPGVTTAARSSCSPAPCARACRCGSATSTPRAAGSQRVVQPVSLVGGFLQGYDEARGENRTFAVHRITSVALVEEDDQVVPSGPRPVSPSSARSKLGSATR